MKDCTNSTISKEFAIKLLYKFLRKKNLLYEYMFETAEQRDLLSRIEEKTMRKRIESIMNAIITTYCDAPRFSNPPLAPLFSSSFASFSWNSSQRGFEFWCKKSEQWSAFLYDYFGEPYSIDIER